MGGFVWSRNVVNVMICVKCFGVFPKTLDSDLDLPSVCAWAGDLVGVRFVLCCFWTSLRKR